MKKCVFILVICACIAACGKKNGAAPIKPPPAYVDSPFLYVKIDSFALGTDSATISTITYPGDSAKQDVNIMAVKSIGGVGYALNLYISNFTGVSTYIVSPPQVSATYFVNGTRHYAQSGRIVVATDSNNVVTGTFSFVADSLTATQGAFNVVL